MPSSLIELTASIVSAHAATLELTQEELLTEIQNVHATLKNLEEGRAEEPAGQTGEPAPAMSAKKSIQKNQITCLLCGKGGFKTLTRHLSTVHNMKPAAYRKQVGLPAGTPLVAKAYSEARREAAIKNNLGEKLAKGRVAYQANQKTAQAAPKAKPAPKKATQPKRNPVTKETPQ